MSDETPLRSRQEGDAGDGGGGGAGESAPLQTRAAFLENWHWQSVADINERLCRRRGAQHGTNSETFARWREVWETKRKQPLSLLEALEFFRACHRQAPFLFYNGNTFAEIARTLTDAIFAELPAVRRRQAASLAAHHVAGVLDREPMVSGIESLIETASLQVGDRVRTLKGSKRGIVRRILPDGRIAWFPDGGAMELLASPESLLRDKQ
jgi:hypothetical protein